jgi:hypothetical protein
MSVKSCCRDENLEPRESGKPDLALKVCLVCGARHFELTVGVGRLGLAGKTL